MRGRASTPAARSWSSRLLTVLLLLGLGAAGAPSCGSACPGGQQEVCTPDSTSCVCADACATFAACGTADPTTARYCETKLGACLPALFFNGSCGDSPCANGECATDGSCLLLCQHSSECQGGGCCGASADGNPHCLPAAPQGSSYPPGTCRQ